MSFVPVTGPRRLSAAQYTSYTPPASLPSSLFLVNTSPQPKLGITDTEEGVVLDQQLCRGESGSYRFIHLERDLKSSHLNPGIATRHCIG